jgi:hypothetical protein
VTCPFHSDRATRQGVRAASRRICARRGAYLGRVEVDGGQVDRGRATICGTILVGGVTSFALGLRLSPWVGSAWDNQIFIERSLGQNRSRTVAVTGMDQRLPGNVVSFTKGPTRRLLRSGLRPNWHRKPDSIPIDQDVRGEDARGDVTATCRTWRAGDQLRLPCIW